MSSHLLVESGSTKTDWCFLAKGKKPVHFKTTGINPNLQSTEIIMGLLETELKWDHKKYTPDAIYYYGAGAGTVVKQKEVEKVLRSHFKVKDVEVREDMLAAARGLCGDQKGVVSILGTGSNSCYYDGKKMKSLFLSLGYVAGDEGSGNHMGKRILQYYNYNTFDAELRMAFEQMFGDDIAGMINRLYSEAFPNRYLASFVPLLIHNRGHYMVENILEDCINDFFHAHILKYRQSWKYPLFFTGSIAYQFKDVIADICGQYELDLGKVLKTPMDGLVKYHQALL